MSRQIHTRFIEISRGVSTRLAEAIEACGPVRLTPRNDVPLCEMLCRIVAGQQLSTKAASTIWGRVVETAGDSSLSDHIAATDTEILRGCGLSNSKARAMKAIVAAKNEGLLDTGTLRRLRHDERSRQLKSIRGVGQWTADMISMFYFADKDVWPQTDVTVWKTLQRLTDKRRSTERTATLFAPHRTYLALYLYRIADSKPQET
ncbi:MAG: hypothetical protein R3C19_22370 [Planctomycetaceae bacterium]